MSAAKMKMSCIKKVKDYLWDNPGASIDEVHEETGVDREIIIKFVKEDRLIADGIDVDLLISCERCGREIKKRPLLQ